jgi:hypothetical protein
VADNTKQVFIAPKTESTFALPADWQGQIVKIPGISALGSSFNRMQVQATPEALSDAQKKFGDQLYFEEVMPRTFRP